MDKLVSEKTELDNKISKLGDGFKSADPVQNSLINIQLHAMTTYGQCLTERIAWLESNKVGH